MEHLPQTELVREKGYEILYLTEDVDEFCLKMLHSFQDKEFKNVSDGDLNLESEEEKKASQQQTEENKDPPLLPQGKLGQTRSRKCGSPICLKTNPVCITSEGGLSLDEEKVLNAMPPARLEKSRLSGCWSSTMIILFSRFSASCMEVIRRS